MYLREVVEQPRARKIKDSICRESPVDCEIIEAIITVIARAKIESESEDCIHIDQDEDKANWYLYQIENVNLLYKVPQDENFFSPKIYIEDISLKQKV